MAVHYEYDKERNLTGLINENGERYTLEYDRNERLVKEIGFDGREQRYQYDKAGFLVAHIDGSPSNAHEAQQVTTTFSRDLLGRLTEKHSPDGDISTFAYDNAGRLTEANNQSQTLSFHYDALGRLVEEQQGNQTLRHQYNSQGLRTQTQLPSGEALNYAFNAIGQLQAACFKDSTGNEQIITELKHNPLGLIAERQQGQLKSEYDYDAMGRLAEHRVLSQSQKHAVIQRHYHYTSSGNLEGIDDLNKGSTRYFYDAIDRLKEVEGFVNEQFDFDPANNLIQQSEQPKAKQNQGTETPQEFTGSNVISLDKAREQKAEQQTKGNRLAFQGDRHFTYDSRGNLIKEARGKNGKLITSYTYNAQNQLVEVDNCGTKTQYQYDALGRRTKKTSTEQKTEFLWDGDVLLSETQHGKNAEQKELLNAKIYVFEPYSFKPLAQIQNNEIYHYHLDHLGTPQELTNNRGEIVWSARYKTYGNLALKDVDDVENNLRFQGQYFDQETGLHYNRHRYYNPNTGQFTQQDPIGLLGGLNNYQYAPNPVGWIDPFGLTAEKEDPNRQVDAIKAVTSDDIAQAIKSIEAKGLFFGQDYVYIKGSNKDVSKHNGAIQEKIRDLNDPNATLNYPMIAADNVIVEGHHTMVAMELTGHLDNELISGIKHETKLMLEEDGTDPTKWNHGATKTPSSDVRILDENGALVRKVGNNSEPEVVPNTKTIVSSEMEEKILYGQRALNSKGNASNRIIGAHSGQINNADERFAVETLSVNTDGTRNVKLITQFEDGNVSRIKSSTLFPEGWSDADVMSAVNQTGSTPPLAVRASDGASLHQSTVNGVKVEVIKVGDNVTAAYPCGRGCTDPSAFGG